ncbi:MAG TPA: hypothetical protein VN887_06270 [Candidatus Angelobacter sp.]|nr:hypothetical protein [Candidatus Angelobacter sp.]
MNLGIESLGAAILKGVCSSEAKDLAVDWSEFGLDILLDDGLLKDAPMIGSVVKFCTISKTIRDRIFLGKVCDFMRACPRFSDSEKEKFVREQLSDQTKANRLGHTLVLILDKLDDLCKPLMLARFFTGFVRGEIGWEDFRRLASAIDIGFVDDLTEFASLSNPSVERMRVLYPNLVRTGLVGLKGPRTPGQGGISQISYQVTELGKLFQKSMNEPKSPQL